MSEQQLWHWLSGLLPPGCYSRIESETSPGFPDVDYQVGGVSGKIELKDSATPDAPQPFKNSHHLLQTQINWIGDFLEHDGRLWILAGVGDVALFIPGQKYLGFNRSTRTWLMDKAALAIKRRLRQEERAGVSEAIRQLLTR